MGLFTLHKIKDQFFTILAYFTADRPFPLVHDYESLLQFETMLSYPHTRRVC